MHFDDDLGPVNHIVLGFAGTTIPSSGFEQLRVLDIDERINILDIEFLTKNEAGEVTWVTADDVGLPSFAASATQLIDESDVEAAGAALANGSVGAIVIWEDLTLHDVLRTWKAGGGEVLSEGPVSVDDLVAAVGDDHTNEGN